MVEPIRVILADDHAVVRKGIREFLEEDGEIQVVAEAVDGAEAVAMTAQHQPQVAVLDIQMPRMNGIEATRRIKTEHPQVKVLILTAYDDDPYIFASLQAGASGYAMKTAESSELVRAVKAVARGESALDPVVARKVVRRVAGRAHQVAGEAAVEPLTEREIEVLRLAARGDTNRAIGRALGISDRTVQGHLANIFAKLRVNTRTEAALKAVRLGWLSLEDATG